MSRFPHSPKTTPKMNATITITPTTDRQLRHIDSLDYGYYFMKLNVSSEKIPVLVCYLSGTCEKSRRLQAVSLINSNDTWADVSGEFTPITTKIEIQP